MNAIKASDLFVSNKQEFLKQCAGCVRGEYTALMLFGSYARGDFGPHSDVDILQITESRRRPYKVNAVNVSVYDANSLLHLSLHGSLFVLHLREDGSVLSDESGLLKRVLNRYKKPKNYNYFRSQLKTAVPLLDCGEDFYAQHWREMHSILVFIIRSLCFAKCDELGSPLFSVSRVAKLLHDPRIAEVCSIKYSHNPNYHLFGIGKELAAYYLGVEIKNVFGSIESLLFENITQSKLLKALSAKFSNAGDGEDFYTADAQSVEELVCPLP